MTITICRVPTMYGTLSVSFHLLFTTALGCRWYCLLCSTKEKHLGVTEAGAAEQEFIVGAWYLAGQRAALCSGGLSNLDKNFSQKQRVQVVELHLGTWMARDVSPRYSRTPGLAQVGWGSAVLPAELGASEYTWTPALWPGGPGTSHPWTRWENCETLQ